ADYPARPPRAEPRWRVARPGGRCYLSGRSGPGRGGGGRRPIAGGLPPGRGAGGRAGHWSCSGAGRGVADACGGRRMRPYMLIAPAVVFLAFLLAGPLVVLVRVSFYEPPPGRGLYQSGSWSAQSYRELLADPTFREVA